MLLEKANIPEGQSGDWCVETYEISDGDAAFYNLRCAINGRSHMSVRPGKHTKLLYKDQIFMSDTPFEINTMREFYVHATGHVLITGLGLGLIAASVAQKESVETVIVIEKSYDVIELVAKHYDYDNLIVVWADAFTFNPRKEGYLDKGQKYDWVFHDIWPDINPDNYGEMKFLHRRYAHWAKNQISWSRFLVEAELKKEKSMLVQIPDGPAKTELIRNLNDSMAYDRNKG